MSQASTPDTPDVVRGRLRVLAGRERDEPLLPQALTSFVGREGEVTAARELLGRERVRLLTLTGPSGTGKTRLAVAVAEAMEEAFPDGRWFVSLAAISDPSLAIPAIAAVLDIRQGSEPSLLELIARALRGQDLLIVLDNFEQVLPAAAEVAALLRGCPRLKVLVTSRAALRVNGEHEMIVPPLGLPDPRQRLSPAELSTHEAVALFVQRAHAVRPEFTLNDGNAAQIVEICRRLDGLPLAIELAAARSKVLSPAALLSRLAHRLEILVSGPLDQPARQQTMQAAIAWSYDLLNPAEQSLFRWLSVFVGGFTVEAAEAVAGAGGWGLGAGESDPAVLDGVGALVDRSLLRQETGNGIGDCAEPRLGMLGTIRDYAQDRLAESGEAAEIQHAHAAYFLRLAEEAAMTGPQQGMWVGRLAVEHEDLRAALRWFEAVEDWEAMLRMTGALAASWYLRGHLREGVVWLDRILERTTDRGDAPRARALLGAGHLHWELGAFDRAQTRLEECLQIADALNDGTVRARALMHLGLVAEKQGEDERARARYEESLVLFRSIGDEGGVADALMNLGDVAYRQRDWASSATWTEEGLVLCRTIGDRFTLAGMLGNAAQLALQRGDTERALTLNREALEESAGIRHTHGVADGLAGIGAVALGLGRPTAAARFLGAASALCEELGAKMVPHHGQFNDTLVEVRSRLDEERFAKAWAAGRVLTAEQAVAEAMTIAAGRPAEPDRAAEAASDDGIGLSTREIDVLRLLIAGQSDREIGAALFISPRTAQGHVASILAKLGAKTRTAAVVVAIRRGVMATADAARAGE